ncbi:isochorismate synthase 2 [Citrus sinensis]|uniref:Isochorismate synthase 2 n=1 Tax=Citrus sinensis TaxID=2711 RepID=A0ACB8LRF2_CITSI|nr:isochorismate synthase 2 [Citrus sinensis]
MASAAGHCLVRFMDPDSMKSISMCTQPVSSRHSLQKFHHVNITRYQSCSLSMAMMNGCKGDPRLPVGIIDSCTLPAVPSPALALEKLHSAIFGLKSNPPPFTSGIIRLQVPIEEQIQAIDWLHAQHQLLPRCFFSGRSRKKDSDISVVFPNGNGQSSVTHNLVSVAGVGSAVFFRNLHPFSYNDWRSIKRFISTECPMIRAYGAMRFDARANISSEWEDFGSFYFMIPQVEFDELERSSTLAVTLAWDDALSWTWAKAISTLESTMDKVSSKIVRLQKEVSRTFILSNHHSPSKMHWDLAVKKALEIINRSSTPLTKVVLARSSRVITATDIDPIAWLACLKQVEGENAYQFCLQPPDAPAFIGNTAVCNRVVIEPKKAIRKLPRVQHLYARLAGRLRSEDEEKYLTEECMLGQLAGLEEERVNLLLASGRHWWKRGLCHYVVILLPNLNSDYFTTQGLGALIYAGTGIVEGSNPSLEWDELELKTSQFTKFLKLEVPLRSRFENIGTPN